MIKMLKSKFVLTKLMLKSKFVLTKLMLKSKFVLRVVNKIIEMVPTRLIHPSYPSVPFSKDAVSHSKTKRSSHASAFFLVSFCAFHS